MSSLPYVINTRLPIMTSYDIVEIITRILVTFDIEESNIIALGEPSRGDGNIQRLRLSFIKGVATMMKQRYYNNHYHDEIRHYHFCCPSTSIRTKKRRSVIVCWALSSRSFKMMNKISNMRKGLTYDEYAHRVKNSSIDAYMKYQEYIDIMYWCYINSIKMCCYDGNDHTDNHHRLIKISKKYKGAKIIALCHNKQASLLGNNFPGISFALHAPKVHSWLATKIGIDKYNTIVTRPRRVSVSLGTLTQYKSSIFITGIDDGGDHDDDIMLNDVMVYDQYKGNNYHCIINIDDGRD